MTRLLDSPLPLVAAPMAGGITTVALAQSVASAGAFPFLAGGYKDPEGLSEEISQMRSFGAEFGVNLFVPPFAGGGKASRTELDEYWERLEPEAAALGVTPGLPPPTSDNTWEESISLLLSSPVPVVSLTFGLPYDGAVAALQSVGTVVMSTVTNAQEAQLASRAGVSGLFVQGSAAGGHSAVFDPSTSPPMRSTEEVVEEVRGSVDLPIVAAGGVDGPSAVARLLEAGAEAVCVGTMLLLTHESGTSPAQKQMIQELPVGQTVLTRAYTGRPARALRNGFIDRNSPYAPSAYPQVHYLTAPLRRAAAAERDFDRLQVWAGTGYASVRSGPASEVIRALIP